MSLLQKFSTTKYETLSKLKYYFTKDLHTPPFERMHP